LYIILLLLYYYIINMNDINSIINNKAKIDRYKKNIRKIFNI